MPQNQDETGPPVQLHGSCQTRYMEHRRGSTALLYARRRTRQDADSVADLPTKRHLTGGPLSNSACCMRYLLSACIIREGWLWPFQKRPGTAADLGGSAQWHDSHLHLLQPCAMSSLAFSLGHHPNCDDMAQARSKQHTSQPKV